MAESVISSALSTIGSLAITETKFLKGVPEQIESLKRELRSMQGFLRDADLNQAKRDNNTTILVQEITDAVYEAENVIARIDWMHRWKKQNKGCFGAISRYANVHHGDLKILHEVGNKIEKLKNEIPEIFRRKEMYSKAQLGETSGDKDGISYSNVEDDINIHRMVSPYFDSKDDVVVFDNEIEKITQELLDPLNKKLTFVSLVGMGGIGKSTLARKVFTDPNVQNHFQKLAWLTVSQSCKPAELLKDIMKQIMGIRSESSINGSRNENVMGGDEVRELNEFLKDKRYLIVIDDIWTEDALDRINFGDMVFPDLNNGSRIILTTRSLQVAQYTNYTNHIHELKPWDDEKSWEFMRKKTFHGSKMINENTLNELENLGKKLANKCDGLPLALSILGGILSKNIDPDAWSRLANNLNWAETHRQKRVLKILALSFYDLPYYLKPCFLYLACFPEDHLISTSELIKMWIAEGFIPLKNNSSHEETARKYLYELANRSMVQVVKMSKVHGLIKKIRVHDILREFCIEESAKIGFLKICNNLGNVEASTSDDITTYRVAFDNFFSNEIGASMPSLRTLVGFKLPELTLRRLKYLRVLELVGITDIKKLPKEIGEMIFLRYFGLRDCSYVEIPSSIKYLINLQTFDARYTRISSSSSSIWKIPTLRHLYMCLGKFQKGPKPGQLQNVQTLHIDFIYTNKRVYEMITSVLKEMRALHSLSLLRIPILHLEEVLPELSNHQNLQELEFWGNSTTETRLPDSQSFPPNLTKLKLCDMTFVEDPMRILEVLPSLVLLELNDCRIEKMRCLAGGFRQLQYLSVSNLYDLRGWEIEVGSMPRLSKLRIISCSRLEMQPRELVHLPALQELELIIMPRFPKETCDKLEEKGCKVVRREGLWF